MDKVSVIIPTYNRAHLIERAIRSVLAQSYSELEVIVVDDGSSDNTQEIVGQIEDERIIYQKLPENRGVSFARNAGAKAASGEWIAFQDSDDCWRSDKLEAQLAYAGEHPEYPLIYCAYLCHMPDGREVAVPVSDGRALQGDAFSALLLRNTVGAPTMLMKKAVFEEMKGFDTTFKSLEDWEFVLRYAKDHTIGYVDRVLVDVYLSNSGISSATGAYFESRCRMIAGYYRELRMNGEAEMAIEDLFRRAEAAGVLESVKSMLLLYLQKEIK